MKLFTGSYNWKADRHEKKCNMPVNVVCWYEVKKKQVNVDLGVLWYQQIHIIILCVKRHLQISQYYINSMNNK